MKKVILELVFSILIVFCALPSLANKLPAPSAEGGDSITIEIKLNGSCVIPPNVKFSKYSVWELGGGLGDFPLVDKDSVCRYRTAIEGFQQFNFTVNNFRYDIVTSPNEKIYHVEINCQNGHVQKEDVIGSDENKAWTQLITLEKTLNDTLKEWTKDHPVDDHSFPAVKKLLLDYQQKVSGIIHDYPNTYTSKLLCSSEILPQSTLSSLKSLRENYLNREAFSNPGFYGTVFPFSKIFANYFLLLDKHDTAFTGFVKALDIAARDVETDKMMQQLLFSHFYMWNREQALVSYIDWANRNPGKMVNQVVQARLRNIAGCMPGNPYTDVILNDTNGVTKKLSDAVAGAKLTLLIFYSPTCFHCGQALPQLVPVWDKFKGKGLKIYAVGQDATHDQWVNFINTKGTGEWTNVFREQSNTPEAGSKYNIGPIPAFILIDHNGKILTRLSTIDETKDEIPEYFGQ